jgi:3-deoxy-7-phosphoheptulonate synthase
MAVEGASKTLRHVGAPTARVRLGMGLEVGNGDFIVVAGPCALETSEQLERAAQAVNASGAQALRGGAFKPRTSPYSFQGLGESGLKILAEQGRRLRLPVVSEILDVAQLPVMLDYVDVLQIGARNMQNFPLLRAVSKVRRPVLLKRGFGSTLEEWLFAAEYILDGGNDQLVLCERGIRSFDTTLRNTLDLAGVAWMKEKCRLPILVDPSHSTGDRSLVTPMALASAAAGADGILVEVHPTPETALCDGAQALTTELFGTLMSALPPLLGALGRRLAPRGSAVKPGGTA